MARNVLFIMCDQLRWDYLGCTGHPTIRTPNIDALAARGVNFSRAYVQSPICGPSRACTYTGRYVRSHGSDYNNAPLRVGEWTLGDHLQSFGARAVLCGKTHAEADTDGLARLGIAPDSTKGRHIAEYGFDVWDRLDGLHPKFLDQPSHYNDYLRAQGFDGDTPWQDWAATAVDTDGTLRNGWLNCYAHLPARIPEEHSETAYSTNRAIEFMDQAGDTPWCLHLSYIKPHWPMVAPAPYHEMYGPDDVIDVVRTEQERENAHPVYASNHAMAWSKLYEDPDQRARVIACYMGLITQIDDHVGRLMAYLERSGQSDDTMIIFTSDHGDYLGDHWMGEKLYFHDASVRVPLIVVDPTKDADRTRGKTDDRLVESIDLAPTIIDFMGGPLRDHILEGRSLVPLVQDTKIDWRKVAFAEADFSRLPARTALNQPTKESRMIMAFDGRWKYIYTQGQRPMLFDLEADPNELTDLGEDPRFDAERTRLKEAIFEWTLTARFRTTVPDSAIENRGPAFLRGVVIGFWDEADLEAAKARVKNKV
ncbi:sulfatase-like hydrolase/transferase [Roseobacteraceae bacterium S113]